MNGTTGGHFPSGQRPPVDGRRSTPLRRGLLASILLVLVQAGLGMGVNLYVTVPAHHPGAHPSDYFAGSYHSLAWALAHATPLLAAHDALGLFLVVTALGALVHALRSGQRAVTVWTALGTAFVVGAGFNGASFLDFGDNVSSLIMALLAFGAIGAYAVALSSVARPAPYKAGPGPSVARPAPYEAGRAPDGGS